MMSGTINLDWDELLLLRRLAQYTASYHGIISLKNKLTTLSTLSNMNTNYIGEDSDTLNDDSYLILTNVTQYFSKPCVLDLKMGRQTFEPDTSSPEKAMRERLKYPQQDAFGFRIVGMRIYNPAFLDYYQRESIEERRLPASHEYSHFDRQTGFIRFDKGFGRSLDDRQKVGNALRLFFQQDTAIPHRHPAHDEGWRGCRLLRKRVVRSTLEQLGLIELWFQENKRFAFYSSSLLIVIEGDSCCFDEVVESVDMDHPRVNDCHACIKMIDFGHVQRRDGGDEGYLHGISVLTDLLNGLLLDP